MSSSKKVASEATQTGPKSQKARNSCSWIFAGKRALKAAKKSEDACSEDSAAKGALLREKKDVIKEYLRLKSMEDKPVKPEFVLPSEAIVAVVKLVVDLWRTKRDATAGEALKYAQSIQWCANTLLIRYPLLKQLRVFESESDYGATFMPLGVDYPRVLVCKNTVGLDVKAFFVWAHNAGVSAKEMQVVYRIWRRSSDTSNAEVLIPEDKQPSPEPVQPISSEGQDDEGVVAAAPESRPMSLSQLRAERAAQKMRDQEAARKEAEAHERKREEKISQAIADALRDHPGCTWASLLLLLQDQGCSVQLKALKERLDVVCLADGCYSARHIVMLEEAGATIGRALDMLFDAGGGYTSAHELFKAVREGLDDFFYENGDFETEREVYDLAVYFFEKRRLNGRTYLFYNNTHIWRERPDYDTSDFGLLIHWARLNDGVMTKEYGYEKLAQRGATTQVASAFSQAIAKAMDRFWVVEDDVYLLKEGHEVSQEILQKLKDLLNELWTIEFEDPGIDFIPMGIISDEFFAELPQIAPGRQWTPCLLQSVIADYTKELGYRTMMRANAREVHAAIMPVSAEYDDYSDVVRALIKAVYKQPSKDFYIYDLHKFLVEHGLWPEEVGYSSFLETTLKKNINFQFVDKNNLVVT